MNKREQLIRNNLSAIINELAAQPEVGRSFNSTELTYDEAIRALREYVDEAHEYGVAYEVVVATLEKHSFGLSGRGAVRLLETGLIMGYKTERPEDSEFDLRK